MTIFTLWYGTKNSGDCETLEIEGEEIFAVTFADEDAIIEYRVFEIADGSIFVHNVVRCREVNADIDVYDSIEAAAKDYAFLLCKAGVV
jgi:hypothetical protein